LEQPAAFEDDRLKLALNRAVSGDAQAFADLVREHQGMVFSIAYHFLRTALWRKTWRRKSFWNCFRV
jgi:hypothetical protein